MTEAMTETVIEDHPIYHAWYFATDEVVQYNSRKVPVLIYRHQKCEHCPTECYDVINVTVWERLYRRYKYVRGTTINRVSKEDFLRNNFLATTDLPAAVKKTLRGKT